MKSSQTLGRGPIGSYDRARIVALPERGAGCRGMSCASRCASDAPSANKRRSFGICNFRRPGIQPLLIASLAAFCLYLQQRQERPTSCNQIHAFILRPVIHESMHLQSALLLRLDNVRSGKQYLCLGPDM